MRVSAYEDFINNKHFRQPESGFTYKCPDDSPLRDYQRASVEWALARGKAAIFKDTGWSTNRGMSDEAAEAVRQATLDLLPDILRLAELRLEAKHKHQSMLARTKRQQVADFLGEEA